MSIKLNYDGKESVIDEKDFDGAVVVRTSPFYLSYAVKKYFKKSGKFGKVEEKISSSGTILRDEDLKSLDGLLLQRFPGLKIEVKKGVLYLQGKSIEKLLK